VARDKPTAAKKLRCAFYEGFRMLARQPLMGRACPNLRSDLRAFSIGNYVIFYVPTPRCVQIERVLHGGRDIHSLF
jgi:toxin ParE1/3/4